MLTKRQTTIINAVNVQGEIRMDLLLLEAFEAIDLLRKVSERLDEIWELSNGRESREAAAKIERLTR